MYRSPFQRISLLFRESEIKPCSVRHRYLYTPIIKKQCHSMVGKTTQETSSKPDLSRKNFYQIISPFINKLCVHQAICDLPTLDIKLYVRGLWFDCDHEQDKRIAQPPSRDMWLPLHADQVKNSTVRRNPGSHYEYLTYATKIGSRCLVYSTGELRPSDT